MTKIILVVFCLIGAEFVFAQSHNSAPLFFSGGANSRQIQVMDSSSRKTSFQVMGDGRVFARELEITVKDFPDYVFEPEYPLMPLDSLQQYIVANGHLPNIPSAISINRKDGAVNVAQLLRLQMEKIEELTLYILQLQERLRKLEEKK